MKGRNKHMQDQLDLQVKEKFNGSNTVNNRMMALQRFVKAGMLALFLCFVSSACTDDENDGQPSIEEISFENYPRMDGSTSTSTLNTLIACKLLGVHYEWFHSMSGDWFVDPNQDDIPEKFANFFNERIQVSKTHASFLNLIEDKTDIILTQSTISPDEKAYADELGITLIETPIALDAFIFLVNPENPVKNLTVEQVQRIYTGELTNWKQVGGNDNVITPYTRPTDSGSQQTMLSVVMGDLKMADFPEVNEIETMAEVFPEIHYRRNSISYTFNGYKEKMLRVSNEYVPKISINGIYPDENTIKNKTYPFTTKVYAVIRSDIDHNSMAYQVYKWLLSGNADDSILESGFVPQDITMLQK